MKHKGRAAQAAGKFWIWAGLLMILAFILSRQVPRGSGAFLALFLFALVAALFVMFVLYFFRDPDANVPTAPKLVLSPGHGKVDAIEEIDEPVFMGGRCKRISTFLSVVDVHVQCTPAAGTVKYVKHIPGKFLNAMAAESATENENVLIGLDSAECPGTKIGVRLIAGLIARRILPWVTEGESVARGERMSLIQFGSRVDVYVPLNATVNVKLGDRVVGGESVLATLA